MNNKFIHQHELSILNIILFLFFLFHSPKNSIVGGWVKWDIQKNNIQIEHRISFTICVAQCAKSSGAI